MALQIKYKQKGNFRMKLYLAGMGADDKELLEVCKKEKKVFRRLITFAYMSDANKIINLKSKDTSNEKKRITKRIRKCKTRSGK